MRRSANRTAVVLAAGYGSRLDVGSTHGILKPLLPVAGTPLILRTFGNLEVAGCSEIVVVVGHKAEVLKAAIASQYRGASRIRFAYNPHFDLANGVSVLAAADFVGEEFVLSMSDHVFEPGIMQLVRAHEVLPGGATLCVDHKIEAVFDMDDATKVLESDGRLVSIGKKLEKFNCVDIGLFVASRGLLDALERVYRERGNASLSEGVQALANSGNMRVLDVSALYWQDVDTPEMLSHAEEVIAAWGDRGSAST